MNTNLSPMEIQVKLEQLREEEDSFEALKALDELYQSHPEILPHCTLKETRGLHLLMAITEPEYQAFVEAHFAASIDRLMPLDLVATLVVTNREEGQRWQTMLRESGHGPETIVELAGASPDEPDPTRMVTASGLVLPGREIVERLISEWHLGWQQCQQRLARLEGGEDIISVYVINPGSPSES